MENYREACGEIVETYRQPDPREVVETYSRPWPGRAVPAPPPEHLNIQPMKRSRKYFRVFLICFVGLVLLIMGGYLLFGGQRGLSWDSFEPYDEFYDDDDGYEHHRWMEDTDISIPPAEASEGTVFTVSKSGGTLLTAQEVYRKVNPSVVTVMASSRSTMSVGTGVIFTENGYIVTNHHVLEGSNECVVTLDNGYMYDAGYVAGDATNDLAILKIDGDGLPAAEFANSDTLTVGDRVYAIGNPLGVELRGTLTDGIVSAINRDVWVDDRTMTLIQTNAALNTGNSGGPLINAYGQVVGINVIKMSSDYMNVEGLGFAIPSASMLRIVNDLLAYGAVQPEPLLGVSVLSVAEQVEDGLWGIRVDAVTKGGAGDLAGIQKGDILLTADGEPLTGSQDLLRVRSRFHLGDAMKMTLWRDGEILEVTLLLTTAVEELEETAPWYAQ